MDINKMNIKYSYIGDSIKFIMENEQRIKNLLLDYECHTKNDRHPSGIDVKTLTFSKKNVKICFSPLRIDFDYGFTSILDEDVNSYDIAVEESFEDEVIMDCDTDNLVKEFLDLRENLFLLEGIDIWRLLELSLYYEDKIAIRKLAEHIRELGDRKSVV